MVKLRRGRKEERICARRTLDDLVVAFEFLAELECVAVALEPALLATVGKGEEPLLEKSLIIDNESVLITDAPGEKGRDELAGLRGAISPGERVALDGTLGIPGTRRQHYGCAHEIKCAKYI